MVIIVIILNIIFNIVLIVFLIVIDSCLQSVFVAVNGQPKAGAHFHKLFFREVGDVGGIVQLLIVIGLMFHRKITSFFSEFIIYVVVCRSIIMFIIVERSAVEVRTHICDETPTIET